MIAYRISPLVLVVLTAGCNDQNQSMELRDNFGAQTQSSSAKHLPFLRPGSFLGLVPTYEELPEKTAVSMQQHWQEAVDSGMSVGRVHVSWADLEPQPEQYDLSELTERLAKLRQDGLPAFVLLETIDSESYSLPPDLVETNDATKLAGGRLLNDPAILSRFKKLLDRVVPEVVSHDGWLLSVGNEPDNVFDDLDAKSPEGVAYWNSIVEFTHSSRKHVQELEPKLAVTMTLTQAGLTKRHCDFGPLIDVVDVVAFNYYYQDGSMNVKNPNQVHADVAQMIDEAGGRSIVLQEAGCPAGYSEKPSSIDGSEETQKLFLVALTEELNEQDRFRAAFWFTMVDWSAELSSDFVSPLRDNGLTELADKYEETMRTWGLIRFEDGTVRPAWTTFLECLTKTSNSR